MKELTNDDEKTSCQHYDKRWRRLYENYFLMLNHLQCVVEKTDFGEHEELFFHVVGTVCACDDLFVQLKHFFFWRMLYDVCWWMTVLDWNAIDCWWDGKTKVLRTQRSNSPFISSLLFDIVYLIGQIVTLSQEVGFPDASEPSSEIFEISGWFSYFLHSHHQPGFLPWTGNLLFLLCFHTRSLILD